MFEKRKQKTSDQPAAADSHVDAPAPSVSASPTPDSFSSRSTAVIGKTIRIQGTITGEENLIVEGTVEGSIDLPKNDLTIGETGKVEANLTAKAIRVDGNVQGDISGTEKVTISKSGVVRGNIIAPRVTLEDGAKFKGSIDMDPSDSSADKGSKQPARASATPSPAPAKVEKMEDAG